MKRNWKEIPKDDVKGQWSGHYVTLNPKGRLVMSRWTYSRLNEPKAFLIWFDEVNNVIGLKPTNLASKNAFPACKTTRTGGRALFAHRLITECGLILPDTIRFQNPEIEAGVLILDLRTAKVSERAWSQNGRRKKQRPPERDAAG